MKEDLSIKTIDIREIPDGVIPLKYLAEELNVKPGSLRTCGIRAGYTFYKFADMVICVNKEEYLEIWNNRNKAGRPWHKEKKQ